MKKFITLSLLSLALSVPAAPRHNLTIYDGRYAVVREGRAFALVAGENELIFDHLPALILDGPVRIISDDVQELEQSFQYHTVDNELLLQQSLGKPVRFYLKDSTSISGKLIGRAGREETPRLVIEQANGSLRTIINSDIKNYEYANSPLDYSLKPALTFNVASKTAGSRDVEISYEVQGLSWEARYLLELSPNDSTAILGGRAVITNASGGDFENAALTLVSGNATIPNRRLRISTDDRLAVAESRRALNVSAYNSGDISGMLKKQPGFNVYQEGATHVRGGRDHEVLTQVDGLAAANAPTSHSSFISAGEANYMSHSQLYGLQFYSLPQKSSLPNGSEKELTLLQPVELKVQTRYEFAHWISQNRIGTFVSTANTDSAGLGIPLPAGEVQLYRERSGGVQEFVGQVRMPAADVRDPLRFQVGFAEDLTATRTLLKSEQHGSSKREEQWEVRLRNDRDTPVEVVIQERFNEKWKIPLSSQPYQQTGDYSIEIPVTIAAESEEVVTYDLRLAKSWKERR